MATKKGIHISGIYGAHHKLYAFFIYCTLISEKSKVWTESYFILFSKLNDHPIRCFNFGLR